jgi:hypothetical protein
VILNVVGYNIYIKIMLKKIDKIFIILMTIFLVINILAIGFIFVDSVSAETMYTCTVEEGTTDAYECPPKGRTRVQVAIPGLTETCTYKTWELNDKGEPVAVPAPCYSAASLPDFVRRIYTFSIGVIAVVAVFMIMIAGLTLIFAAGNASAISRAKSRITVSILGVVLALLSYAILDTLNPRLTNLSLPGIQKIEGIGEPGSLWCDDMENKKHLSYTLVVVGEDKKPIVAKSEAECGSRYDYGYFKGTGDNKIFETVAQCNGRAECNQSGTTCMNTGIGYYCLDPEEYCSTFDKKNCSAVTKMIRDSASKDDKSWFGKSCFLDKDFWYQGPWMGDNCAFGSILTCGKVQGSQEVAQRVSCLDNNAAGKCSDGGKPLGHCTDDVWANSKSSIKICCKHDGQYHNLKPMGFNITLDCNQVSKCEHYEKFDGGNWLKNNDKSYCNVGCP